MIYYRFSHDGDAPLIEGLLKRLDKLFPIPLSAKINLGELSKKLTSIGKTCIAMEGDDAIGMVGFYANDNTNGAAYISVVGVVEEYQGQGIARQMIKHSLQVCSENDMKTCTLYTHKTNSGAIAMYEKLGFVAYEDMARPDDIKFIIEIQRLK